MLSLPPGTQVVSVRAPVDEDETMRDIFLASHDEGYLRSLSRSSTIASIVEVWVVAWVPLWLLDRLLLAPMRWAAAGSLRATEVAMQHGVAVNLGGGFHHACHGEGGGFCVYADIAMCIRWARERAGVRTILIVDLDAHQGNGHARDKLRTADRDTFILDMYNADIYPGDREARAGIDVEVRLTSGMRDGEYLRRLRDALAAATDLCAPDLVIYNAGTDILDGDTLGCLSISPAGVARRDSMVFSHFRGDERMVPVVMLLSGGYGPGSAPAIAASLRSLDEDGHDVLTDVEID
jgi:histone deacetylase 11